MTISRNALISGWTSFFQRAQSFFITLTFNWRETVSPRRATKALNDLSYQLDSQRLGSRFYQFGLPQRTLFFLLPEKFTSYPHYHGLVMTPDDSSSVSPQPEFTSFVESSWKRVVPSGTCFMLPFENGGALEYASKETSLSHDLTSCSIDYWSSKSSRSS